MPLIGDFLSSILFALRNSSRYANISWEATTEVVRPTQFTHLPLQQEQGSGSSQSTLATALYTSQVQNVFQKNLTVV